MLQRGQFFEYVQIDIKHRASLEDDGCLLVRGTECAHHNDSLAVGRCDGGGEVGSALLRSSLGRGLGLLLRVQRLLGGLSSRGRGGGGGEGGRRRGHRR